MSSMSSRGTLVAQVRRMADAGELQQALELCEREVAQNGSDMELWSLAAEIHNMLGQRQQAMAAYRQAAHLAEEKGEPERAIVAHKAVISMHSQDVLAQLSVAEIYRKQGQFNRAALAYEIAAQELAAQGRLQESLATVQQLVNMSPSNVGRRILLAEQYMKADMTAAAVRELEAAAASLQGAHRAEEYARVIARLRILDPARGEAVVAAAPQPAQRGGESASQATAPGPLPAATQSRPTIGQKPSQAAGEARQDDASVYIAEADTFLRLGLVTKASEHLAAALARNPFLPNLREPLIKLYVAQGQHKEAVVELWKLLAQGPAKQEELRYLRYILRLDSGDKTARRRLDALIRLRPAEETDAPSPESAVADSMAGLDNALRGALDNRRPSTDLASTALFSFPETIPMVPSAEQQEPAGSGGWSASDSLPPPSATTRPGQAQIELLAEEIALSSKSFQEEIAEVDHCLRQANYPDARRRLQILAACYPHSQLVRTQLGELEAWAPAEPEPADSAAAQPQAPEQTPELTDAIADLKEPRPRPSQRTPTLTALLARARPGPNRTTIEIESLDIEEEHSRVAPPPPPARTLPPSARRQELTHAAAAALLAFEGGVRLRARGEYGAAIIEFDKALGDAAHGARAALMIGLCLRAQNHLPDAITSFMRGVNMHWASESDLSELFYELGSTYEQSGDAKDAILFFQLALGSTECFRDTAQRIAALQQSLHRA